MKLDRRAIVVGKGDGFWYVWIADGSKYGKYVDASGRLQGQASPFPNEWMARKALANFRRVSRN